jgi:hypothetical protein
MTGQELLRDRRQLSPSFKKGFYNYCGSGCRPMREYDRGMADKSDIPEEPMFEDISGKDSKGDAGNTAEDTSLKAYREALEQEWKDKNDPTNARQTAKNTKDKIRSELPDYITNMRSLAMGAISESVKYQANKFLIEAVLNPGGVGQADTLAELLQDMEEEAKKQPAE